nr:reverse transcriptase domain-containing protein [Tanacetum cinerariifolium]
ILFIDGSSSTRGSRAGLVRIGPSDIEYTYALRRTFPGINNETEYEALLAGLRIARQIDISNIEVKVDSKLVASQINGSFEANKDNMIKYMSKAKKYAFGFKSFLIENNRRNMNQKADMLSKLASVAFNHFTKEANYVIREIHIGSCGMHVGPRVVVRKAIRQGYNWPTMHEDAKKEVKKCDSRQIQAPMPRLPKTLMTSIMAPWSFYQWAWTFSKHYDRQKEEPNSFGLPRIIVTDNEAHLVNDPFKSWCGREEYNKEEMRLNLDLLQERRETTAVRKARYKTKMKQYYNNKVRPIGFRPREFVF